MSDDTTVELLIFELGGARYATDLAQVRRVDRADPKENVGRPLGQPSVGRRALVFAVGDGPERRLEIDNVLGVRTVPVGDLRRMPAAAAAPELSPGAWIDGDTMVLLVDLHALT